MVSRENLTADFDDTKRARVALSFVVESNLIENIYRPASTQEIEEHIRFVSLRAPTIEDLVRFVSIYQLSAVLRDREGMCVSVSGYSAPAGGFGIVRELQKLLMDAFVMTPFELHCKYELLHPFSDCNGRSGRALWAWAMYKNTGEMPSHFLKEFYYQSLEHYKKPK